MPLTPRDRRTLTIGGVVLGVLLAGFLVMNLLSGGDDGAIPSLPPITVGPDEGGGGGGGESPSPTGGVSPIPVFTGRDPFSVPPGLSPEASASVTTSVSGSVTVTVTTSVSTSPTATTSVSPTDPGGGSSEVVGGKTVVLLSVFMRGGEPMVQVEVDGQVFNDIGIGDSFDNGRYELRSVSGNCATFLFGDESFTLCASSTK